MRLAMENVCGCEVASQHPFGSREPAPPSIAMPHNLRDHLLQPRVATSAGPCYEHWFSAPLAGELFNQICHPPGAGRQLREGRRPP